jgi:hypothetical protein
MLLPIPLNSAAKAYRFEDKKKSYAQHNLRMVKEVHSQEDWNLPAIEEREAKIVAWAKSRWDDI